MNHTHDKYEEQVHKQHTHEEDKHHKVSGSGRHRRAPRVNSSVQIHKHHCHENCGCGCGHHHSDHEHHNEHMVNEEKFEKLSSSTKQKIYILENLGCANCAAKMEKKINDLPEVEAATITYATKQLRVASNHQEQLLPVLQEICASIESEVVVKPREDMEVHSVEEQMAEKQKAEQEEAKQRRKDVSKIVAGAILFVAGIAVKSILPVVSLAGFVIAYVILGREILGKAAKNLTRGHVFDENFLMSIATIGAFVIGEYPEAVGVMLFFRVGELFEEIAVARSRSQIMKAVDMRPEVVNLIHGEEVTVIPAGKVQIGDKLLVRPGDRIPLDGTVLHGESRIDTAPVTGEPVPVRVVEGDEVISGCVNTSGTLHICVEKTLEDSMVTRILNSVENAAASKPKIDRFITKFARVYTPFVVALAIVTAIIPSMLTGEWNFWIYTAITFLVISCPCALVLSVPLAFFSGIGAASKRSILFKGGLALETLKNVKAVIMDKTGTITKGNFEVQRCVAKGSYSKHEILALAASCEMDSTHPIGYSIVSAAKEHFLDMERPKKVEEISGKGIIAELNGDIVLCGNKELMEMYQIVVDDHKENVGSTEVFLARNNEYIGCLVIADTVKKEASKAIQILKRAGLRTIMLTGDTKECAEVIAKETGVESFYAKLLPEDKLKKLQEIRKSHGSVMFVGDGINDAPVLAGADVGAAMGSGADAAIEAADVVFMTSSMEAIPEAITLAKETNRIAMQNVVFALLIKAIVMILGLFGFANMWMAVFADTGVAMLCVLNSIRILHRK